MVVAESLPSDRDVPMHDVPMHDAPTSGVTKGPHGDVWLPSHAQDTISSLSWSPRGNHLATASWDGCVRVYDVANNMAGSLLDTFPNTLPPKPPPCRCFLDCDWGPDGRFLIAGCIDGKVYSTGLDSGEFRSIGHHGRAVSSVRVVDIPGYAASPVLASGSWNKTVRLWDVRQPESKCARMMSFRERVYSIDSNSRYNNSDSDKHKLLYVALADESVHIVDLRYPRGDPIKRFDTERQATYNTRSTYKNSPEGAGKTKVVRVIPGGGYGVACGQLTKTEGTLFKAHRTYSACKEHTCKACRKDSTCENNRDIWPVSSMQFHPSDPNIMVTADSNGRLHFQKTPTCSITPMCSITSYYKHSAGITATAFNHDGTILAYATGYDWHRGCNDIPTKETNLYLHKVTDKDMGKK
ncbi:WD40-repeat-containing domain protein [Xylariaceae sp. FL0594]|nr:WD40-repeat-containing domain protein [Xylariaceae sp. FL0594]